MTAQTMKRLDLTVLAKAGAARHDVGMAWTCPSMRLRIWLVMGLLLAGAAPAALAQPALPDDRKNWFDDPFFQVSSALAACPQPEGPMLTFEEQRKEAHWRAERGTSCWLAGACRESNAYRYDKSLAAPVAAALKAVPDAVNNSSVWVTIQRRWVFLEGCASSAALAAQLEDAAKAVPDVETVVPMLRVSAHASSPYPVATPAGPGSPP